MAYEGELLNHCPAGMFNFARTYAVIVTGAAFNPYGHMLLNTGGPNGRYFHVSDVHGQPRMMTEAQFQLYLADNHKTIVTVMRIDIPRPADSQIALEKVLSEKWLWGMVVHNCETMVEDIVVAGGGRKVRLGTFPLPMNATNKCEDW